MKSNKELLNHINYRIKAYKEENGSDDALKILNNCKNHISKNIKTKKN